MNRKIVSTGLLAGLVAGSGAGLVLQQTGLAGASSTLSAVVAESAATNAAQGTHADQFREVLQPLVDDGTLTADQLDAVVTELDAARPAHAGKHGHGGHRGERGGRGWGLEAAATALGLTSDELRAELAAGTTIAALATERGVDVQAVIDAMVAEATSRLTERLTAGVNDVWHIHRTPVADTRATDTEATAG